MKGTNLGRYHIGPCKFSAGTHGGDRLRVCLVLLVTVFFSAGYNQSRAEWVEWIADTELGALDYDNINRSAFEPDERSDKLLFARANLGRLYQFKDETRFSITANIDGRVHDAFGQLDSLTLGATASIWHKFGIGATVPWLRFHASAAHMNVSDDVRDSDLYEAGLRLGKRFGPRFDGHVAYRYTKRDGGEGPVIVPGIGANVFDQSANLFSVLGNYLLAPNFLVSAGYTYFKGDLDSNCTPDNVGVVLAVEDVKAITRDNVFGGCVYRLDSKVNIWSLEFSYGLLEGHASANLGFQYHDGKADVLTYDSSVIRASFIYSY